MKYQYVQWGNGKFTIERRKPFSFKWHSYSVDGFQGKYTPSFYDTLEQAKEALRLYLLKEECHKKAATVVGKIPV